MDQKLMEVDKRNKKSGAAEYAALKKQFWLEQYKKRFPNFDETNPGVGRRFKVSFTDEQKQELRKKRAALRKIPPKELVDPLRRRPKITTKVWRSKLPDRGKSKRIAKIPLPDRSPVQESEPIVKESLTTKFPVSKNGQFKGYNVVKVTAPPPTHARTPIALPNVEEEFTLEQRQRGSGKLVNAIQRNADNFRQMLEEAKKNHADKFIFWQPKVNSDMASITLPEEVTKAINSFHACPNPDLESIAKVKNFNVQLRNWALHLTEKVTRVMAHKTSFQTIPMRSNKGIFDVGLDFQSTDVLPISQPELIMATPKVIFQYISKNDVWGPPFPKLTLPESNCDDPWPEFEGKAGNADWLEGILDQPLTVLDANSDN